MTPLPGHDEPHFEESEDDEVMSDGSICDVLEKMIIDDSLSLSGSKIECLYDPQPPTAEGKKAFLEFCITPGSAVDTESMRSDITWIQTENANTGPTSYLRKKAIVITLDDNDESDDMGMKEDEVTFLLSLTQITRPSADGRSKETYGSLRGVKISPHNELRDNPGNGDVFFWPEELCKARATFCSTVESGMWARERSSMRNDGTLSQALWELVFSLGGVEEGVKTETYEESIEKLCNEMLSPHYGGTSTTE